MTHPTTDANNNVRKKYVKEKDVKENGKPKLRSKDPEGRYTPRIADPGQLEEIWDMVFNSVVLMMLDGLDQWNLEYPTKEMIKQDLDSGNLWALASNEKLTGMVVLNENADPEYDPIEWLMPEARYLCVHKLLIKPALRGNGFGALLLHFAIDHAIENGYDSVRLDGNSTIPWLLKMYRDAGFQHVGDVHFPMNKVPFKVFELVLKR